MRVPTKIIAVLAALMLSMAGLAIADPITGLYNTGLDDAYQPDPHYGLTAAPTGVPRPLTAYVTDSALLPGAWLHPNNDTSKWIGPYADLRTAQSGIYEYTLEFDLTGFIPSTVVINGRFATDNPGYIYVNGVDTGQTNSWKSEQAMYGTWTDFLLNSSNSSFHPGSNTLMFQVHDWGWATGLRVEMAGAADVVPEPFSMAFLGSAFVGVVACRLRRRRKEAKK